MKKNYLTLATLLLGALILTYILSKISLNEIILRFSHVSSGLLITYILVSISIMVLLTARWQIILRSQKHYIDFLSLFQYRLVGYAISYVTPAAKLGGEPVRAALLKRKGLSFHQAFSGVVIDKTVELTTNGIFFITGIGVLVVNVALPENMKILAIITSSLIAFTIFFFFSRMLRGKHFFYRIFRIFHLQKIKQLQSFEENLIEFENLIIKFYKEDKKHFLFAILFSFLSWLFMFLEYKVAILMLGYNIPLLWVFLVFSFIGIAYILPLPMALGSLEASQIGAFALLKIPASVGIALSFLVRTRDLIWSAIGFGIFLLLGITKKEISTHHEKRDED
ncbi:hypothetical protein CMO92_04435 [Candidatus Woesearchaeota archaeon]|nr:hypothetical protein [Candidatus Woesearchaeota archaeon]|tara:strand:+ start:1539 stop:2549 length:1011 start_codon:yes stop_codon:yes gene_type:complete